MMDERLWHVAEELAHENHENMESRSHEEIQLVADTNRMELEQAKERACTNKQRRNEKNFQAWCQDNVALADQDEECMLDAYENHPAHSQQPEI